MGVTWIARDYTSPGYRITWVLYKILGIAGGCTKRGNLTKGSYEITGSGGLHKM